MSHTKHKPMATTAYDTRDHSRVPVRLTLEIDWDKLARHLADKAYVNKSGKTRFLNGCVVAHVNVTKHTRTKL